MAGASRGARSRRRTASSRSAGRCAGAAARPCRRCRRPRRDRSGRRSTRRRRGCDRAAGGYGVRSSPAARPAGRRAGSGSAVIEASWPRRRRSCASSTSGTWSSAHALTCLIGSSRECPSVGERVVDADRHRRGDGAGDQAVALEGAQGLGEHLLADAGQLPATARRSAAVRRPATQITRVTHLSEIRSRTQPARAGGEEGVELLPSRARAAAPRSSSASDLLGYLWVPALLRGACFPMGSNTPIVLLTPLTSPSHSPGGIPCVPSTPSPATTSPRSSWSRTSRPAPARSSSRPSPPP